MEEMNPILMVSLTCCIGPLVFGGLFFALGRWSSTWRIAFQRRGEAEIHAHSEAVGFAGNGQAEPPPQPREKQRAGKLQRQRFPRGTASTTRPVDRQ